MTENEVNLNDNINVVEANLQIYNSQDEKGDCGE